MLLNSVIIIHNNFFDYINIDTRIYNPAQPIKLHVACVETRLTLKLSQNGVPLKLDQNGAPLYEKQIDIGFGFPKNTIVLEAMQPLLDWRVAQIVFSEHSPMTPISNIQNFIPVPAIIPGERITITSQFHHQLAGQENIIGVFF